MSKYRPSTFALGFPDTVINNSNSDDSGGGDGGDDEENDDDDNGDGAGRRRRVGPRGHLERRGLRAAHVGVVPFWGAWLAAPPLPSPPPSPAPVPVPTATAAAVAAEAEAADSRAAGEFAACARARARAASLVLALARAPGLAPAGAAAATAAKAGRLDDNRQEPHDLDLDDGTRWQRTPVGCLSDKNISHILAKPIFSVLSYPLRVSATQVQQTANLGGESDMGWREWALYRIRKDPRVLGRLYPQEFLFEHQEMQGSKTTLQCQRAKFPSNLPEYTTRLPMVK